LCIGLGSGAYWAGNAAAVPAFPSFCEGKKLFFALSIFERSFLSTDSYNFNCFVVFFTNICVRIRALTHKIPSMKSQSFPCQEPREIAHSRKWNVLPYQLLSRPMNIVCATFDFQLPSEVLVKRVPNSRENLWTAKNPHRYFGISA